VARGLVLVRAGVDRREPGAEIRGAPDAEVILVGAGVVRVAVAGRDDEPVDDDAAAERILEGVDATEAPARSRVPRGESAEALVAHGRFAGTEERAAAIVGLPRLAIARRDVDRRQRATHGGDRAILSREEDRARRLDAERADALERLRVVEAEPSA